MQIHTIEVGELLTNCYIVVSENKKAVIIDPGAEPAKIIAFLESHSLVPQFILLTHGHYDHIEAIEALKTRYPLQVYVGREDAIMINKEVWILYLKRNFSKVSYDLILQEKEELNVDELRISTISTPGHSAGSLSFLIGDNIFTGDCLFADGGVGRTDLWQGSLLQLKHSIEEKLFKLPDKTSVYPGHGSSSSIGKEKEIHRKHRILR